MLADVDRRRAGSAPVLRGHRRDAGRLRVGLRAPAPAPARARGERRRRSTRTSSTRERFLVKRPLLRALAHDGDDPAGAADRRGRPRRRRVRGVPARAALRLDDLGARARRGARRRAAGRGAHLEPHPRRARRARSAAASTTGSRIPTSNASSRSSGCAHPEVRGPLARDVAGAVEVLRDLELYKPPGVAETIDWAQSLATLGASRPRRAVGRRDARARS